MDAWPDNWPGIEFGTIRLMPWIGGSCPNINSLPSKNEIWSAKVANLLRDLAQFGSVTGTFAVEMAKVRQRQRDRMFRSESWI